MRAKRQALEEETLKKRLHLHQENSKELAERVRESEHRYAKESEGFRFESEERLGELIIEKSELKDKILALDKQLYSIKRERNEYEGELVSAQNELQSTRL